jgi:hypothetical protein
MNITRGIFFVGESQIKSSKTAKEIASKCPILISVSRYKHNNKMYVDISVHTHIYLKNGVNIGSGITDRLIGNDDYGYFSRSINGTFETFEESEKWIRDKLDEIRNNRMKIIGQKDTSLEYILIE